MSYDIRIIDKNTGHTIRFNRPHDIKGGTFAIGWIDEAWLNITYNYYPVFSKLFGENGIRSIYGNDIGEMRFVLEDAVKQLKDDVDPDYWKCTEGNVKAALKNLIELTDIAMKEFPEVEMVWNGD